MKTLGEIHHKRPLQVVGISENGVSSGRLAALGFLPGSRVRVSRIAPLGDPISIEMNGQEISLRRAEASVIEIEEIDHDASR